MNDIEKYKFFRKQLQRGIVPDGADPSIDYGSEIIALLEVQIKGLVGVFSKYYTENRGFHSLEVALKWLKDNAERTCFDGDRMFFNALSALPPALLERHRLEREVLELAKDYRTACLIGADDDSSRMAILDTQERLFKADEALQAHKKAIEGKYR